MKNIFRVDKSTNPFAQIDRRIFENPKLSWKAKGLLGYLLSRPDDWRVVMGDLVKRSTDGEDAIRSALAELRTAGHARLEQLRDEGGTLAGTRWIITEAALPVGEQTEMPVFPISDKPDAVNPPLNNKEGNENKISPKKKEDELTIEAERFVEWFLVLLKETGAPDQNLTAGQRSGWADAYAKLVRIDGRAKEEIVKVCRWARRDPFWAGNFLSPSKLRQKNKEQVLYYDVFLNRITHDATHPRTNGRHFEAAGSYAGITDK